MPFASLDPARGLDEFAVHRIYEIANTLIRCYGFPAQGRLDYEQDLATDLVDRFRLWDPAKGARTTFVATVLNHKKVSMIRAFRAECRFGRPISIDSTDSVVDGEPVTLSQAISNADKGRRTGQAPPDPIATFLDREHLKIRARKLTVRERNLLRLRKSGLSIVQAAKVLGITPQAARYRFRRIMEKVNR